MNAAEFAKDRARIEREASRRSHDYSRKAMAHLVRDAGAVVVSAQRKAVAWKLPDGSVVCVKNRYTTQAQAAADLARIKLIGNKTRLPVRSYWCAHCKGFHLTSMAAMNNHAL